MSIALKPLSGKWSKRAPMPVARSHFGTTVYNGKIYVFGGGGEGFKSLNLVHVYDPLEERWSTGTPMPTTRSGVVAVDLKDRIYVMGGGFKRPDGTFNFLTTVEIYDPGTDSWEKGPDLQMRHDAPAAAALNGKIYLFGGHHPEARGGPLTDPATDFAEVLDPRTGAWEAIGPMPTPRFSLAGVADGEKILAMGGGAFKDGTFRNYDLVETYDPTKRDWRSEMTWKLPWPSAGLGGCVVDDKVCVFGGNNGEAIQKRAAYYDAVQKRWFDLPDMNEPHAAMGVAVLGNSIYVLGGRGADGKMPVNTVEVFLP